MISTSRTRSRTRVSGVSGTRAGGACQRRQRALYLTHDPQRDGERFATILARNHDRLLSTDGGDEALELQPQRFALGRVQWDALHECLERQRPLRERGEVDVATETIELAVAGSEVERDVPALLEDAHLAHALA